MNVILKLQNVTFGYDKEIILENINLEINKGDFIAIIGKNGSGKSTLLKLFLGLQKQNFGVISKPDSKSIGYVQQLNQNTDGAFPATVKEIVMLGLYSKLGLFKFANQKHKQMVKHALTIVGMQDFANHKINLLSGGQQQKVLIAKALVSNPDILILDEAVTGIDSDSQKDFFNTLVNLNKHYNKTIIMVTHNLDNLSVFNKVFKIDNKNLTKED